MSKIIGIDVSYHNGIIDWEKVKNDNIKFAIIREGYRNVIDTQFINNVKGAVKNNIPVMVYHFIYTDGATIKENASSTISNMVKAGLNISTTFVWVDLEYDTWKKNGIKCTKSLCSQYTKEYIDALKELGCKKIGIYMNNDYYKNYYTDEIINNYPIWLADPTGDADHECVMQQYSSSGKVDGINSYGIDMNYLFDESIISANYTSKINTSGVKVMTEIQLRQSVVNFIIKYKGIKEGSDKHKEIISIFNNSGLCTRYKMTVNDAWCATTVSSAFIANGLAGKSGSGKLFECVECSCNAMITLAKKQGIWVEKDSYVPKTGDVIFYDWQDGTNYKSTENIGTSEHVGVVVSCDGENINVIEGNKSDTVGYRSIAVNGRYIRGFAVPNYSKFSISTSSASSTKSNVQNIVTDIAKTTITSNVKNNTSYVGKGIGYAVSLYDMNIRSKNDKSSDSYKVISKGTKVEVLEITSNGWFKIVWTECSVGYAYTSYQNGKYYKYTANVKTSNTSTSNKSSNDKYTSTKKATESANSFSKSFNGTYKTTDNLNIRNGAGTNKIIMCTIPKNTSVRCYGYYTKKWLYVKFIYNNIQYYGFAHSAYLKKQ